MSEILRRRRNQHVADLPGLRSPYLCPFLRHAAQGLLPQPAEPGLAMQQLAAVVLLDAQLLAAEQRQYAWAQQALPILAYCTGCRGAAQGARTESQMRYAERKSSAACVL